MNILVINLTRFGDLLQSAAAVRALAGDVGAGNGMGGEEKHRIGVVCLENFTAGAELLPEVSAVYPLPASTIMRRSNAGNAPRSSGGQFPGQTAGRPADPAAWLNGLGCLYEWVEYVRADFRPDAIYNISPFTPSSLLGRLLAGGKNLAGFSLDDFGFFQADSLWASFIQGASGARATSPYNIVDLFRKVAKPESVFSDASLLPVAETPVAAMRERLAASAPEPPAGFVTLQLGASADIRRWPVASFAQAGQALWERHRLLPVLAGTKSEIPLGEEYAARATHPFADLMGQTGLTELAAALTVSRLCISNDTGTLHLASGLGIPVLGIYLATAQPWDTGPHAAGNCSLEPDLPCHPCNFNTRCANAYACHTAVTPETVIRLASAKIAENQWVPENFSAFESGPALFPGSRVWESIKDDYGFADLRSLSGHEREYRTQWMRLQRHLYRQFFDRIPGQPFTPEHPENAFRLAPDACAPVARACDECLALLDAMAQQAAMLTRNPLPVIRDRFSRTWQRLAATLRSQPDFTAIAFCWQTESMRQTDIERAIPLVGQYHSLFSRLRGMLP